jgi:hypothetical protein
MAGIEMQTVGVIKCPARIAEYRHHAIADRLDLVTGNALDKRSAAGEMGCPDLSHPRVAKTLAEGGRSHDIGKDNRGGKPRAAGPFDQGLVKGIGHGRHVAAVRVRAAAIILILSPVTGALHGRLPG